MLVTARPKRSGTALLTPSRYFGAEAFCVDEQRGNLAMFEKLKADYESIKARDPAVRSMWEVLFL